MCISLNTSSTYYYYYYYDYYLFSSFALYHVF